MWNSCRFLDLDLRGDVSLENSDLLVDARGDAEAAEGFACAHIRNEMS